VVEDEDRLALVGGLDKLAHGQRFLREGREGGEVSGRKLREGGGGGRKELPHQISYTKRREGGREGRYVPLGCFRGRRR